MLGGSAPIDPPGNDENSLAVRALRQGIEAWVELMESGGMRLSDRARTYFLTNDPNALAAAIIAFGSWPRAAPRIACPALLYAGDQDGVHDGLMRYAEELPRATFQTVLGAGHAPTFADSARTLPFALDFLNEVVASADE